MKKTVLFLFFFFLISTEQGTMASAQNYKIVRKKEFTCLDVCRFTYPVFQDWESLLPQKENENHCIIYFKHPPMILYEQQPQIRVEIRQEFSEKGIQRKKNPAGIPYEYVYDPVLYTKDHVPRPGDWDWLVFYGEDFGVRISRAGFGDLHGKSEFHEFGHDAFYNEIIKSFKFVRKP